MKAGPELGRRLKDQIGMLREWSYWCPGPDSNRHGISRGILSPLRLPISPPGQIVKSLKYKMFKTLFPCAQTVLVSGAGFHCPRRGELPIPRLTQANVRSLQCPPGGHGKFVLGLPAHQIRVPQSSVLIGRLSRWVQRGLRCVEAIII